MIISLTAPCPRCQHPYDVTYRKHTDRVWCQHCGKWAAVIIRLDGSIYLAPVAPPDYPRPAPREE